MRSDQDLLRELNFGYVRAAESSDVRWFDEHLAEDFMASNPDGSLADRAGFLARMASPYPGSELEAHEVQIRILGEAALVHARFAYRKPTALEESPMEAVVRELNDNYIRAVRMSDVRWFDEHLAADFLNSNADGSLVDRAGFLAQIARPCPVSDFGAEDVRIRMLGEMAIVHGRTVYRKVDGAAAAGRYTDVWLLRGERWLCVAGDITRG